MEQCPLSMADQEFLETVACLGSLWDIGDEIEERLDEGTARRVGRPREYRVAEALIFSVAVWVFESHISAHDNLAYRRNWQDLAGAVEAAWPDGSDRRLSSSPITRFQHLRFRKLLFRRGLLDVLNQRVAELCLNAARGMGMLDPDLNDSLARPDKSRIVTGDGTWRRGPYNTATSKHPRTGRSIRCDPDARSFRTSDGPSTCPQLLPPTRAGPA